ncbi:MAG: AAA family ATPase [Thermodesulfobacteriota bacterium]|jgi:ABC-type lipoprotein export system ATPase subunit
MDMSARMWVSRIEISNLAGSNADIAFALNTDVNVFFGDNGSGKTSLLKILHAAASNTTDITDVPFESAKVTLDYFGTFRLERSIVNKGFGLKADEAAESLLSKLPSLPSPATKELNWESTMYVNQNGAFQPYHPEEKAEYVLPHQYLPTSRLYLGLQQQNVWEQRQLTEQELEQNFAQRIKELWREYNFDLSKAKSDIQEQGLATIMKDVWSSHNQKTTDTELDLERAYDRVIKFFERQYITDIVKSFSDFKSLITVNQYLMDVIRDINGIEEAIERAMIPKNQLLEMLAKLYGEKLSLTFEEKQITVKTREGKEIALGSLSSGQKQLLMVFLRTLMASGKPILIDEPEISMHVDWQSDLIGAMHQLSPSTQIIMATHSPEISASVPSEKLFRL